MLAKIALSSFLTTFVVPNSNGFLMKAALYNLSEYNPWLLLLFITICQSFGLLANYWFGSLLLKIPSVEAVINKGKNDFKKRAKILELFNIACMIVTPFWTQSCIPFASLLLGTIGSNAFKVVPLLILSATIQTLSMIPSSF